jgi:C1A family cysteine protease
MSINRTNGTEGPVRNQGDVGACTAFSVAAAIDHDLLIKTGQNVPVSVMHLWLVTTSPR